MPPEKKSSFTNTDDYYSGLCSLYFCGDIFLSFFKFFAQLLHFLTESSAPDCQLLSAAVYL